MVTERLRRLGGPGPRRLRYVEAKTEAEKRAEEEARKLLAEKERRRVVAQPRPTGEPLPLTPEERQERLRAVYPGLPELAQVGKGLAKQVLGRGELGSSALFPGVRQGPAGSTGEAAGQLLGSFIRPPDLTMEEAANPLMAAGLATPLGAVVGFGPKALAAARRPITTAKVGAQQAGEAARGYVSRAVETGAASAGIPAPQVRTMARMAKEPLKAGAKAAKEPWQMTRAEFKQSIPVVKNARLRAAPLFTQEQVNTLPGHPAPRNNDESGMLLVRTPTGEILGSTRGARFENVNPHRVSVEQALSEGKPVPAEVLADYPDLVKAAPAKKVASNIDYFGGPVWTRTDKSHDSILTAALDSAGIPYDASRAEGIYVPKRNQTKALAVMVEAEKLSSTPPAAEAARGQAEMPSVAPAEGVRFTPSVPAAKLEPLAWAKGAMATHLLAKGNMATTAPRLDAKNFAAAKKILQDAARKGDTEAAALLAPARGQAVLPERPLAPSAAPATAGLKSFEVTVTKGTIKPRGGVEAPYERVFTVQAKTPAAAAKAVRDSGVAADKVTVAPSAAPAAPSAVSRGDFALAARNLVDKHGQKVGNLDWTVKDGEVIASHSTTGREYGSIDLETGAITPLRPQDRASLQAIADKITQEAVLSNARQELDRLRDYPFRPGNKEKIVALEQQIASERPIPGVERATEAVTNPPRATLSLFDQMVEEQAAYVGDIRAQIEKAVAANNDTQYARLSAQLDDATRDFNEIVRRHRLLPGSRYAFLEPLPAKPAAAAAQARPAAAEGQRGWARVGKEGERHTPTWNASQRFYGIRQELKDISQDRADVWDMPEGPAKQLAYDKLMQRERNLLEEAIKLNHDYDLISDTYYGKDPVFATALGRIKGSLGIDLEVPSESVQQGSKAAAAVQRAVPQAPAPQAAGAGGAPPVKPPTQAAGAVPPEPPGFAANIRLSKYPEDLRDSIKTWADTHPAEVQAARRGVRPDALVQEDARKLVEEMGGDFAKLQKRWKPGEAWNAEEITAIRGVLREKTQALMDAGQAARSADTTANQARLLLALQEQARVQQMVHGITAESGRALRAFRQDAMAALQGNDTAKLEVLLKKYGGDLSSKERADTVARMLTSLDLNDPAAINAFVQSLQNAKFWDYILELYYNSILSGPKTHVINSLSNTVNMAFSSLERGTAAGVEAFLAPLSGRQRQRFFSEVPADLFGMMHGFQEGTAAALSTLKNGISPAAATKWEFRPHAFRGNLGRIINTPSTMLEAADAFFYAPNYRSALSASALRKARMEGLKGGALESRIADLLANPTEELTAMAVKQAEYRLFRQEPGKVGQRIMALRDIEVVGTQPLRLVIPFLRTPMNILKYGLERSPAGIANPRLWYNIAKKDPEAADQIARLFIGSALAATVAALFLRGKITAAAPTSAAERDRFYREGKQPFSIRIGDKWVQYQRLEPFNQSLAQVASAAQSLKDKDKDALAKVSSAVATMAQNLAGQSYLTGISNAMNAIMQPERYGDRYLTRLATGFVPAGALLRTAAQMTDKTIRRPETLGESLKAGIPGLSKQVPPSLTAFGEEAQRQSPAWSPIVVSPAQQSAVDAELERLGVEVGFVGKTIAGKELSREMQRQYQVLAGQMVYQALAAVLPSEEYKALPAVTQERVVNKLVNDARDKARAWVEVFLTTVSETPRPLPGGQPATGSRKKPRPLPTRQPIGATP